MPRRVLVTVGLAVAAVGVGASSASAALMVTGPATVAESGGSVTYTVDRQLDATTTSATVSVAGSGSAPATPGQDFGAPPQTITFSGNTATFSVPIIDDGIDEPDEQFTVTVTGNGLMQPGTATTTITDDDMTIDVAGSTVAEGGVATVTLTPRGPSPHQTDVLYGTVPGSASTSDYTTLAPATLSWAPNDTAPKTIAIQTTQDALDENDEQFGVLFGVNGASGASLSAPAALLTITDDDPPPFVGAVPARVTEGNSGTKNATVAVSLSAPSGKVIHVPFHTENGTATAPSDYTATSGTLTFNPGETTKAVTIPVKGDKNAEPDETVAIALGAPDNAALAPGRDTAALTIADDDGGAGDTTDPKLTIGKPRVSGSRVLYTVTCPKTEHSCRGTLTLFTVASRRAKLKALRTERRLGRATYRLNGGSSRRVTLKISAANRRLLRRARTVRVRAFAVTTDANGNVGNASRAATLRFS